MKKIFIFIFLFLTFILYSDSFYNTFNYTNLVSEPIIWTPDQDVYNDGIKVELSSQYGKIFYLVNKNLSVAEPVEYTKAIFLKGEKGRVVDYDVVAMLEKEDGRVEFYSRTYRIDRTAGLKKTYYTQNDYFKKDIVDNKESLKLNYNFIDNKYSVSSIIREFDFPQKINNQKDNSINAELQGKLNEKLIYLTAVTYNKNNKPFTEIQNNTIDLETTQPPSFGSLYWGQYYKQSYKIKIKPFNKDDKIYFWFREWKNEDLIFGPPEVSNKTSWIPYKEALELVSKYGEDGVCGLAAFSVGKNGLPSKISGPFYFKVDGADKAFEQVFIEENKTKKLEKKITLNNIDLSDDSILITNDEVKLKFENCKKDDSFYFTFESLSGDGKSELFPCDGEYIFKNNEDIPVEFSIFYSTGEEIGSFNLNTSKIILPVIKKYVTNYVDVSGDELISFNMPKNKVRYEVTTKLDKNLDVTSKSNKFNGSFKIATESGGKASFKIRFGAFDDEDNLISESNYYYFNINKKYPSLDVSSDGVDFTNFHNEQQTLKLISSDSDSKIYYRLNDNEKWILYEKPIIFYPPISGKYEVKIFAKSVSISGNERINKDPFIIKFDRRGVFVDFNKKFSGNGTELSPFNSLERSILFAKTKNIKIIYLLSNELNVSIPVSIDSDIIIEPFKNDLNFPVLNFESKSIWKKQDFWFDLVKNGYLEFRNLKINIKSGNVFTSLGKNKLKIYNSNFNFSGNNDFSFIKNEGGKIGLNNIKFDTTSDSKKFTFLDSSNSKIFMKNINTKINSNNLNILNIKNSKSVVIENFYCDVNAKKSLKFCDLLSSDVMIKNLIFKLNGEFNNTSLFNLQGTNLKINESDFIINGTNLFETKILDQNNSKLIISNSLFRVNKSFSLIGFNSLNSDFIFEKSMLDVKNISDYVYDFRMEKSSFKLISSIVRNLKVESAVSILLNNSNFEGTNNSIFNIDVNNKGFSFWVNGKSSISTINSFYYFNNQSSFTTFIFANNHDYTLLKPIWLSNVISENIVLLENLDKKDSQNLLNDFTDKNIFYNFKDDFKIYEDNFFIPLKDSPLLQGGIDESKSPILISEKDFLGKNRILSGIGIDIGAIQKSGNF